MFSRTIAQVAASVLLHAVVAGLVLVFSSGAGRDEQVYRVTLAEFSIPSASASAPSSSPPRPETSTPEPPKPEPPTPEPAAQKLPEPKTKKISAKKTTRKPEPKREDQPVAPPAPARTASAGPGERNAPSGETSGPPGPFLNIGGLAAYGVDAVDQRPSIAKRAVPDYPPRARRMNVQGQVLVRLVVDASGKPRECAIHEAEPAGYFEEAALAAARKTRFIPGKVRGQPVNTVVLFPFVFRLR